MRRIGLMTAATLLLSGGAAQARSFTPTDADFKAIRLTGEMPTQDLCVIKRSVRSGSAPELELTYARSGRVLRRDSWSGSGALEAEDSYRYTWDGSRLVAIEHGSSKQTFEYDSKGFLRKQVSGRITLELDWKLSKVDKPVEAIWPELRSGAQPIPRQLGYTGTVDIEKTELGMNSGGVYQYERHGTLLENGCSVDEDGRVARCEDDHRNTQYTWSGSRLVEKTGETRLGQATIVHKETYTYDAKKRLLGTKRWQSAERTGVLELVEETRYEYHCEGALGDDRIWP